ncbi:MAG: MGMT family protein [Alphaproteobacteria bacterium]|nr:MGMT family protein [Alphaproteobacteria bacterium]
MTYIDIDSLPGTDFQRDVWRALTRIPIGTVVTYAQLAKMCGHPNAVRAVANAVGKNPMPPIIPCHRVVRSDGKIGGYSAPGGVARKCELLRQENAQLDL